MITSGTDHGPVEHPVPKASTQLLTVKDVVDALRISRSSVYRLFDSGELTWVQIGSSRRVRSEDLTLFIEQHRRLAS
ncbi:helix-turn-helix domain-containing protein [Mycobacterium sp.]|uniref:helix-turn-helix domain-containing protein n=1 Tax=Mycobacterium sp. TaxID=1785 RepID=UPI003F9B90D6